MRMASGKKKLLLGAGALAVLTLAAVLLWRSVFVVRSVVVDGAADELREQIIREAQIGMGGSIRAVNEEKIRRNLEASGRFALDGLEVRLPSTLILYARERTRDAMVLNGGKILVMDADGYVIETCASMPADGGVYVSGLEGTAYRVGGRISAPEEKLAAMKAVLTAIRDQSAGVYVSELNIEDVMNMWITTRTGIRVELGDSANMSGKILWLRSAVADLEGRGEVTGTLDVSSGTKADYRP